MSEEEITYKIYIIDYWVPFPCSEYGGKVIVIAKSEEDAFEVLKSRVWDYIIRDDDTKLIKDAIERSKRYDLKGLHKSEIVSVFIT